MNFFISCFKALRYINRAIDKKIDYVRTNILFSGNGIVFKNFSSTGVPFVSVAQGAHCIIGSNFSMHNKIYGNPIGCSQPCTLFVDSGYTMKIGDNVGISQVALIAHSNLTIGNNVKIGGGTCIYTSDFHSLNPQIRQDPLADKKNKKSAPVRICDNVFIGAHCIILKGVTIGENSIIGAGSVVTKSIPSNQIWAGNPAKLIKLIE